jgi:hypothetical protein
MAKPPPKPLPKSSSHKLAIVVPTAHTAPLASLAHIARELLPKLVRDLIQLMGEADAVALVRSCGGQRLWIPVKPSDAHALAHVLSHKGFERLCAAYGGAPLRIDQCKAAITAYRNACLVADYSAPKPHNLDINQLVMKYGLCARSVERLLGKTCAPAIEARLRETRTLELF